MGYVIGNRWKWECEEYIQTDEYSIVKNPPNLLKIDRADGQEIELGPAATGAGRP
jgi:hypothetical protein